MTGWMMPRRHTTSHACGDEVFVVGNRSLIITCLQFPSSGLPIIAADWLLPQQGAGPSFLPVFFLNVFFFFDSNLKLASVRGWHFHSCAFEVQGILNSFCGIDSGFWYIFETVSRVSFLLWTVLKWWHTASNDPGSLPQHSYPYFHTFFLIQPCPTNTHLMTLIPYPPLSQ